jgi:predicted ATP-dependent endonuclease of OLD family
VKIQTLTIRNYRTLESVDLCFPTFYCAISGKNDSGKTNVFRVLRGLFRYQAHPFVFSDDRYFTAKEDLPRWLSKDGANRNIEIFVELHVFRDNDEGLYRFLNDYLGLKHEQEILPVKITVKISEDKPEGVVSAIINGYEADSLKAQEVLKKLQSSSAVFFHHWTAPDTVPMFVPHQRTGLLEIDTDERDKLESAKTKLNQALRNIAKHHQKEITELLGRLQEKHKIGFSIAKFDPDDFPFSVTLGENEIPIESWGSGTQNRTQILMTLFKAKRIGTTPQSPSKVTPIVMVEEPESFLHPSAQGEFGRLLQELADEFKVQVIVTTHSPYMLSMESQSSNILLRRSIEKGKLRATSVVDTTGENWMEPFGQALGLDNTHFAPWKNAVFSKTDEILLCEGETDKAYFEMLKHPDHGANRLQFDGYIFPYLGRDNLKGRTLIQLIKSRYKNFIVTYDLDADKELSKIFEDLGLQKNKHYFPVGAVANGKDNIEGLLPDRVLKAVYGREIEAVQQISSGNKDVAKSAKSKLKKALLEEFKTEAKPGLEDYSGFYSLAKKINAATR